MLVGNATSWAYLINVLAWCIWLKERELLVLGKSRGWWSQKNHQVSYLFLFREMNKSTISLGLYMYPEKKWSFITHMRYNSGNGSLMYFNIKKHFTPLKKNGRVRTTTSIFLFLYHKWRLLSNPRWYHVTYHIHILYGWFQMVQQRRKCVFNLCGHIFSTE